VSYPQKVTHRVRAPRLIPTNGLASDVGHSVAGTYASLTPNADGSYSYVTNGTSLPSGGAAQDIFSYTASDCHGSTTTTTLRQGRAAISIRRSSRFNEGVAIAQAEQRDEGSDHRRRGTSLW